MATDSFAAAQQTVGQIIQIARGKRGTIWPRLGPTPDHDTEYARWRATKPRRGSGDNAPPPSYDPGIADPFPIPTLSPLTWEDDELMTWADGSTVYWNEVA